MIPGKRCNIFSLYWSRCCSVHQTMGSLKFHWCFRTLNLLFYPLDCMCATMASSRFPHFFFFHLFQITRSHQYYSPILCSMKNRNGPVPFGLYCGRVNCQTALRVGESTRLWCKTINVCCWSFHVHANCIWPSFFIGTERRLFSKSMGTCTWWYINLYRLPYLTQ